MQTAREILSTSLCCENSPDAMPEIENKAGVEIEELDGFAISASEQITELREIHESADYRFIWWLYAGGMGNYRHGTNGSAFLPVS